MYFWETKEADYDRIFLLSENEGTVTYGQRDELCEKIQREIQKGNLAFILCKNTIGSVLSYFACLKNRTVPLLLDAKMDYNMIQSLIKQYSPDELFYPKEQENLWSGFGQKGMFDEFGYCIRHQKKEQPTKVYKDLALLLTTSGSTGSPKLVRQSYQNIQSNAASIAQYLHLDENERPITTLPMHYTYGLSIINSHALCGATILLTEHGLFEQEFWDFLKKERATSFGGVPYTYEMLKRLHFFEMDLPFLKTMTQAGGKLAKHLHQEFAQYAKETNKEFIVMYGQTEATARMSYLPAKDSIRKAGSIGIAIPGGKMEIEDGELVYYGENVTLGYAQKMEDLKKGDERGGKLKTGDMARVDEEGFFYIIGRKKRFLKILGNRVNLDEVEQILKAKYQECELACAGIDDHLFIYMEERNARDKEEILSFISEKTGLNPGVFEVFYIDHIPVSKSGKIRYKELEDAKCHTK